MLSEAWGSGPHFCKDSGLRDMVEDQHFSMSESQQSTPSHLVVSPFSLGPPTAPPEEWGPPEEGAVSTLYLLAV